MSSRSGYDHARRGGGGDYSIAHYSSRETAAAFASTHSYRSSAVAYPAAPSRHARSPSRSPPHHRSNGGSGGGGSHRSRSRSARARRHVGYENGHGQAGSSHHHSSHHAHSSHHNHHGGHDHATRHARRSSRSVSRSTSSERRRRRRRREEESSGSSRSGSRSRSRSHSSSSRSRSGSSGSGSSRSGDDDDSGSDGSGSADGDKEGLIDISPGEFIKDRYEVLSVAGQGTFGTVLDVYDTQTSSRLAIKVVRSVPRYLDAAQVEVDILSAIQKADPHGRSLCVRFVKQFRITHRGHEHVCIAFEKLGRSLYEFIKKNSYRGFSLQHVARFGYQLLTAVAFCHSIRLVHTDLKPENILLTRSDYRIVKDYSRYREEAVAREEERRRRNRQRRSHSGEDDDQSEASSQGPSSGKVDTDFREPLSTSIRLIDFGGATFEHDHHSRIVNTRQYRAPEVVLGLGWSYPSDCWSIGCILPELYTGELLFATHEDLEHLALMERILQRPLPDSITLPAVEPYRRQQAAASGGYWRSPTARNHRDADSDSEHSDASGSTDRSKRSASHKRERSSSAPRADLLLHLNSGRLRWPEGARSSSSLASVSNARPLSKLLPDPEFRDLIEKLLTYDPAKRITAKQALQHPFFRHVRHEFEQQQAQQQQQQQQQQPAFGASSAPSASASSSSSQHHQSRDRERDRERDRDRERSRERDRARDSRRDDGHHAAASHTLPRRHSRTPSPPRRTNQQRDRMALTPSPRWERQRTQQQQQPPMPPQWSGGNGSRWSPPRTHHRPLQQQQQQQQSHHGRTAHDDTHMMDRERERRFEHDDTAHFRERDSRR